MRLCSSGIRFFSPHVLQRDWPTLALLRAPPTHRLPAIRSVEEVRRLLASATPLHHQVSCTTVSSVGLRRHAALFLQVSAIDGQRLQVHVPRGTGATDRDVPLPAETLALLRPSWQTHRHQTWLLPATGRDHPPSPLAASPRRRSSVQGAFRPATHRAGMTTTGVALPPLRHAYAPHRLAAGVHPRLLQRSLGPPQRATTLVSLPLHPHRACRGLRAPPCPQARAPAMTTLRDSCTACAPAYLERSPPLPLAHRQVFSAIHQCHSEHSGHRLSQCHSGGAHHRVHHACGHRHCPPCPQHTSQQWLQHHLERPLPGPPLLRPFPVPETLRPLLRAPHRLADHALFTASALARPRLATADRCIGTDLPGFLGVLHPWGRQLPYHPHLHSSVPGGGLAQDRTTWRPSRAHVFVPVKALSPLDRALCKADRRHAGLLAHITPQGWTLPWNVQSQAPPHGHAACTSLAPSVFRVAISHPRLVSLQDRTVTCTSRTVGRTRPRTTDLDGMELLRRVLQHVVPDGCMTVRPCGLLHARGAIPPDTLRLMLVQAHPMACTPMPSVSPAPLATRCPTCGAPMRRVRRLWTSHRAWVETR